MRWHGMPRLHLPQKCFHPLQQAQALVGVPISRSTCCSVPGWAWATRTGSSRFSATAVRHHRDWNGIGCCYMPHGSRRSAGWDPEPGHARNRSSPGEGKTERIARSRRLATSSASTCFYFEHRSGILHLCRCRLSYVLLAPVPWSVDSFAFVQRMLCWGPFALARRGGAIQEPIPSFIAAAFKRQYFVQPCMNAGGASRTPATRRKLGRGTQGNPSYCCLYIRKTEGRKADGWMAVKNVSSGNAGSPTNPDDLRRPIHASVEWIFLRTRTRSILQWM